ncbi:disulfide bond formation protein DsbB [Aliidongia dinghuensis]|uniref:Disulfide bond formation protein DsbB n=1 Tax=Aliidongia dinghuensis TaxID=1867774 RepID=A0A8J2YXW4_9PROT|nr:disulfide bond formation protein B [Aliidongia dinghuensis]GGF38245.1 disulfide bond formation protein DsbB [Aliidongia dinghuensis]
MRTPPLSVIVLATSIAVLAGAWFFQLVVGLVPCELCLAERWPWYIALVLSGVFLGLRRPEVDRYAPALLGLLFLCATGLAAYHVGVEQHWIAGPDACTVSGNHHAKTIEELTAEIMAAPVVRCDEIQWSLAGISLAGWDAILCVCMVVAAWNARRRRRLAEGYAA